MIEMIALAVVVLVVVVAVGLLISHKRSPKSGRVKTVIVLGSGGHTTEMLRLVSTLSPSKFSPKTFLVADTDAFSLMQLNKALDPVHLQSCEVMRVPRSREVRQSWLSSVWTTIRALLFCLFNYIKLDCDLLLVNGPGTCVPFCLMAWFMNKVRFSSTKIVFVESICRVNTLSLTGKILMYFADHILVQWPELALKYPKVKYIARFT